MIKNLRPPLTPDSDHRGLTSMLGLAVFLLATCHAVTLIGHSRPQPATPSGMLPPPINGIGYRHSHQHCGPGCPGYVTRGGSLR